MIRTILCSLFNGILAAYSGAVGMRLWQAPLRELLWPPMLQAVPRIIYWPWGLEEMMLAGSFLAGAGLTPLLVRWRRGLKNQRRSMDAFAGILWALVIASVVGGLIMGGLTLVGSLDPFDPMGLIYSVLAVPLGAATGEFLALLWFPVTLTAGSIAGLLTFTLLPRTLPAAQQSES
jgi:hypothetical protein